MRSAWSDREIEKLEDLAMNQPPDRVFAVYNAWAGQQGLPLRTKHACEWMVSKRRIADKATGEWVSTGYVCNLLGISLNRAQRWTSQYQIPCYRDGRGRRFFRRADLRSFARQAPERFAGVSADRLFLLLENRQLADSVAAAHPRRPATPKPVRAIETGWTYPSIKAAAAHFGVTDGAIQQAIRTGYKSAGYHWTYA